ncbi:MAG: hypothetical protein ACOX8R_02965 [Bacillota bacterium]|jgi:hypothetical protein
MENEALAICDKVDYAELACNRLNLLIDDMLESYGGIFSGYDAQKSEDARRIVLLYPENRVRFEMIAQFAAELRGYITELVSLTYEHCKNERAILSFNKKAEKP